MDKTIIPHNKLSELKASFKGEVYADEYTRLIYATDASAYRQMPQLVVRPADIDDLKKLISFARSLKTSLIPRAAGTSLAGQVVGGGIVADISKHFNQILEINTEEHWVRVQPGVVLDELNKILEPTGLFFGPETSTSNRCMMGGMVGNNSCGSHSLVYGSTRDHTLEVKALLSDNSEVVFGKLTKAEFEKKCLLETLEGQVYKNIRSILGNKENQDEIRAQFPDKSIHRRNTGYAIDLLLESEPFTTSDEEFNFCKLIAGSEGTLCFITEIKLNIDPLPPKEKALVCVHCNSLDETFKANIIALKHNPVAIELMDDIILEQTKANISQRKNRFFIQGDPAAMLLIELAEKTKEEIDSKAAAVINDLKQSGYGYHYPIVYNQDVNKVWALRKAGLGVLSNLPGDAKPVAVIEDTAVNPLVLPEYMNDFMQMLKGLNLECVYYAHIATGELHLRPVLNLKDPKDVELFHTVALETAKLVKKYRGSLSGEHGDGRLRGEFIPMMIGDKNYALLESIKETWDPEGIFNPGKITRTPQMNTSLRYESGMAVTEPETIFDFSNTHGILRAAEQCNGSADCRKSAVIGGTMCPSYMATKDENSTTRARANVLREFLTHSDKKNRFDHKEIYQVMDLCLSCKGCKSECPSNVDMAKYKAEFLQHWHDANGVPLRTRLIANISQLNKLGMLVPSIFNFFVSNEFTSGIMKKSLGFAPKRTIPTLYKITLRNWVKKLSPAQNIGIKGKVFLFADEFTDVNDVEIGIKAVKLLNKLGYKVEIPDHVESGRAYLSKGFARKAQQLAKTNITKLHTVITEQSPLVGIEPSAILSFRDEYPDLAGNELKAKALELGKNCLMFDEFIMREVQKGNISQSQFTDAKQHVRLHGHCHQKALASTGPTKEMISLPSNYTIDEIKSGCCGMAGSFGYEAEHYEVSMKVGELVLLPEIRKTPEHTIISAPGTSCRHQIKDGTGRIAQHPIEVLYNALLT
ncbi:MAG: FAD-linked oxidase C-terminal domain-containing protein [Bacteroidales bacterium]|nr:FAD-linked oxidase C-terminal domain-containing protein [Bacteroidales bacterium]